MDSDIIPADFASESFRDRNFKKAHNVVHLTNPSFFRLTFFSGVVLRS